MTAWDTVLTSKVNPGAVATAFVPGTSGDVLQVRNFPVQSKAYLEHVIRRGATTGMARVRSALLHDNVTGVQFFAVETPSVFSMPLDQGEPLQAQDNLIVEGTGGAAETDLIALGIYYSQVQGGQARLHSWSDVGPLIVHIKPVHVAVTASATIGNWSDTAINTTENLLEANTDYAVLGYGTSVALGLVGIKGIETANMRICGPGTTLFEDTANFFVEMDKRTGRPHIPVVNASNVGGIFASVADSAASTAADVTIILAMLGQQLPN